MAGTHTTADQRRKRTSKRRSAILIREGALDRLYAGTGVDGFEARARDLGYSAGALCSAAQGGSVGAGLIVAIRNRFPSVPYEQVFTEGVPSYAPRRRAA